MYEKIRDSLYEIKTERPSCTSYLILDEQKNILIDPGLYQKFDMLKENIEEIGIKIEDIDIVLNTHEHYDYFGANKYFQNTAIIMAYKLASTKIINADNEIINCRCNNENPDGFQIHVGLENNKVIEVGNWTLKVLYTPGHTSGSVCYYEEEKRILFTGDTVYAKGTISDLSYSGNYGSYIKSLNTLNSLKVDTMLPGHGAISTDVEEDLNKAILNATRRYEGMTQ